WKLAASFPEFAADPLKVDGGYAMNGWHRSRLDPVTRSDPGDPTWWSKDAVVHLAVGPRPGMEIVREESWFSVAVWGGRKVLALRRTATP
ncbi:MAG TPA: hypothetical protein VNC50_12485, partial [Planctomycetia bacterium]|nr:hypothetical protein [Planctomycetia bacterium]